MTSSPLPVISFVRCSADSALGRQAKTDANGYLCYRLFQKRLRIARSLLDVIADNRLLAEKTGLSVAEVRGLREEKN